MIKKRAAKQIKDVIHALEDFPTHGKPERRQMEYLCCKLDIVADMLLENFDV